MSIADELNHYAGGLEDAYDAVNDMNGVIPANRNMDNLDTAIRTIPQPTVNDGTLTIQKNGTSVATFTANQASNATANITVPTNTSDLNNDSGFITSSSLPGDMTGATSGAAGAHGLVPAPSAGDEDKVLSGAGTWVSQPTVPTVNDGTLTITQGGTTLGTFTANQSGNTTVSIAASSDPGTVFYVLGDDGDGYGIYNITVDSGSLSCDIYSDQAMTTAITGYEFDAAFEAGPVKLMVYADGYGTWDEAYVTICTADDSEYPDYQQYSCKNKTNSSIPPCHRNIPPFVLIRTEFGKTCV